MSVDVLAVMKLHASAGDPLGWSELDEAFVAVAGLLDAATAVVAEMVFDVGEQTKALDRLADALYACRVDTALEEP